MQITVVCVWHISVLVGRGCCPPNAPPSLVQLSSEMALSSWPSMAASCPAIRGCSTSRMISCTLLYSVTVTSRFWGQTGANIVAHWSWSGYDNSHVLQLLWFYLQVLSVGFILCEHCSGTLRDHLVCTLPLLKILHLTQESHKLWVYSLYECHVWVYAGKHNNNIP